MGAAGGRRHVPPLRPTRAMPERVRPSRKRGPVGLRQAYGDSRTDAGARFEQELARLFWPSGWTQEELAKKEGKSQRWVSYRLLFGRFLGFSTSCSIPQDPAFLKLTEGRFRDYWSRTDETESNERASHTFPSLGIGCGEC